MAAILQISTDADGLSEERMLLGPGNWMVYVTNSIPGHAGLSVVVSFEDVDESYCAYSESIIDFQRGGTGAYLQQFAFPLPGNQWVAIVVGALAEGAVVRLTARKVSD